MMSSAEGVVAFATHARDVPATERQRFADRVRPETAGGGLLLETCHRVELYAVDADGSAARAWSALPAGGRALRGEAAVHHAVAVAAGRDSVVVGEDQVLHQLRQALDRARIAGTLDPVIERLIASALRAGRRARSWHSGPVRSLADVAVARIDRDMHTLAGRPVLIVGTGPMGRLAARAALAADAALSVTSRSVETALELATAIGARSEDFDPGDHIAAYAGIVVALAGPWPLGPRAIDALRDSPTLIVDLSVPPAIPQDVARMLGQRLATADDLARSEPADEALPDRILTRLDELIGRTTADFLAWLDGQDARVAARALVERADREREAELAELWRRLPDLDAAARATIEGMARHLGERLLREPLERLGADSDGRHERAVRELWAL